MCKINIFRGQPTRHGFGDRHRHRHTHPQTHTHRHTHRHTDTHTHTQTQTHTRRQTHRHTEPHNHSHSHTPGGGNMARSGESPASSAIPSAMPWSVCLRWHGVNTNTRTRLPTKSIYVYLHATMTCAPSAARCVAIARPSPLHVAKRCERHNDAHSEMQTRTDSRQLPLLSFLPSRHPQPAG